MKEYFDYHLRMMAVGDIDPQNLALRYIANRFELNIEQRYYLAFLFGCTYCAPTVYYIYNEFPDFENVDVERLARWWHKNKNKCLFQTDRLRIKSSNKLVETFVSYKNLIGKGTQDAFFKRFTKSINRKTNYDKVFEAASSIKNFGRFSNFIYLELLHELTDLRINPSELDVMNAKSCRDGIFYALNREDLVGTNIDRKMAEKLEKVFTSFCVSLKKESKEDFINTFSSWGVETSLCAYKKHKRGKRWVGYYLDRQYDEIMKLQQAVQEGVNWKPLWDFRKETYYLHHLTEFTEKRSSQENEYHANN